MLSELAAYFTTSCPQYVRHMDYLYEIIAMRERSRRNRAAWQPHLAHTRSFVLAAAEMCVNRDTAVVMGAGLLLDVPVAELSRMFREVRLLDIVILPEVRKQAKRHPNVTLIQHDVTNAARKLYEDLHRGIVELPASKPVIPEIDERTSLVVSLNILSQLWVMPRAYALKKTRDIDEEQLDDWCGGIVDSHLAYLRSLSCRVCLIADHEFIKRDNEGNMVNRGTTIYERTLPRPDASWTWNIVPIGEEHKKLSKELIVGAWHLK